MPAVPKSFMPALGAFIGMYRRPCCTHLKCDSANMACFLLAFSFTYTAIVAHKEGSSVDAARTRWQEQMRRGNEAMTAAGTQILEAAKKA